MGHLTWLARYGPTPAGALRSTASHASPRPPLLLWTIFSLEDDDFNAAKMLAEMGVGPLSPKKGSEDAAEAEAKSQQAKSKSKGKGKARAAGDARSKDGERRRSGNA